MGVLNPCTYMYIVSSIPRVHSNNVFLNALLEWVAY